MPTVRSLAQLAGVSPATISRVLNNHPHVRPEIRERVLAIIEDSHYHPNRAVSGLLHGQNGTFGCIVPSVSEPFSGRVLAGMLAKADPTTTRVLIMETQFNPKRTLLCLTSMIEQRVAGIAIFTGHVDPIAREGMLGLRQYQIPLVHVCAQDREHDAVVSDDLAIADLQVRYLCKLGHKRIGFAGPDGTLCSRGKALRQTLRRYGLTDQYCQSDWTQLSADKMMAVYRTGQMAPTALVATHDWSASGLLMAAHRQRVRVPEQVSILGCGNLEFGNHTWPGLTTVEQHPEAMGRQACTLLLARASRVEDHPATPSVVRVPVELIIRGSCGPARE